MMQEMVQTISEKASIPPDKVQEVVNLVVAHLKDRLPQPLSAALDTRGLSGMFEKKA